MLTSAYAFGDYRDDLDPEAMIRALDEGRAVGLSSPHDLAEAEDLAIIHLEAWCRATGHLPWDPAAEGWMVGWWTGRRAAGLPAPLAPMGPLPPPW